MATITIRDLDDFILQRLKEEARNHHRSLAGEVRERLTRSVSDPSCDRQAWLAKLDAVAARSRPPSEGSSLDDLLQELHADRDPESRR